MFNKKINVCDIKYASYTIQEGRKAYEENYYGYVAQLY